jgi:class 3 adenylate cyclase
MSKMERRLAAILAADVASYSRLMGADEPGTVNALKEHRRERIDPAIAHHRGRIVDTAGDGLLAEFASVVDAVSCAVAIQRAMLIFNAGIDPDRRLVLRIGINVGDIIIDSGKIFGDGVNVAARLEALCEPGGLCISRYANEQVRDKLRLSFSDLGEQVVKNIARTIGVFGLAASDIAALPEGALANPESPQPLTQAAGASIGRRPLVVIGAVIVGAILAIGGGWVLQGMGKPHSTANSPQDRSSSAGVQPVQNENRAAFAGRWDGHWNNDPLASTSLTIDPVGSDGEVTGSYTYRSGDGSKFTTKIINDTIKFGDFTFRLRPDGQLEGTRNASGLLSTAILHREWGFSGHWAGIWDNNPLYSTSLIFDSISPTGDVAGSYFFMSENPSRFVAKIANDTIKFGVFTFKLRPDGQLEGTRNASGLLSTAVLHRDWGFSGHWVGTWDKNPLYTTSLNFESVSLTGDVAGSYLFMSESPLRFVTKIANDTIKFGVLTFKLRPDGQLEGTRNASGILNTAILHRDWGFSGHWAGIWDNNPLYTTSLVVESVSPTGDVIGSYLFGSGNPVRFATRIADNTLSFGPFAFRLRSDGKLEGTSNDRGVRRMAVLDRNEPGANP